MSFHDLASGKRIASGFELESQKVRRFDKARTPRLAQQVLDICDCLLRRLAVFPLLRFPFDLFAVAPLDAFEEGIFSTPSLLLPGRSHR